MMLYEVQRRGKVWAWFVMESDALAWIRKKPDPGQWLIVAKEVYDVEPAEVAYSSP